MLETVGSVDDLLLAIRRVDGMEWLGELDETEIEPDETFYEKDAHGEPRTEKKLGGRVYMVLTNQTALSNLLSLWQRWQTGQRLDRGLSKWRDIFAQLRTVRPWGIEDRLRDTGVVEDWRQRLELGDATVPCEIELWHRSEEPARRRAEAAVAAKITEVHGRVTASATISEIGYHALLAELPREAVERIITDHAEEVAVVLCQDIQFFRASGQACVRSSDGDTTPDNYARPADGVALGQPVAALFDGAPLQNHERLRGRLQVDDPDDFESDYQVQERKHGTAMASLVLHGELDAQNAPLPQPLYVRPIFKPNRHPWEPRNTVESVPENVLVVDLIHSAVRRLYESSVTETAVAPTVKVINLSLGCKDRPFSGTLGPLARLLDWLAWQYGVLFVVSSGNYEGEIQLDVAADVRSVTRAQLRDLVLRGVSADARNRRLLSPSESLNALTVGAAHSDQSGALAPPNLLDPYDGSSMPSPISAVGSGYRRCIKPDILAPGGRVMLVEALGQRGAVTTRTISRAPGQRVAAPAQTPGDLTSSVYTCGTSNAAALTTRAAVRLVSVLDELRAEPDGRVIDSVPDGIWLQAMLVHTASWAPVHETLDAALRTKTNGRQVRDLISRLIGYGTLEVDRAISCTASRVTALGGGALANDQSHMHRVPLPPSLSGIRGDKRLTVTLAWFTPVNPAHRVWRRASLWFDSPSDPLGLAREQADNRATRRGTVQHEVFTGTRASSFLDGDFIEVTVNAAADAGALEGLVPYTLAVTLEVAEELNINIYDEIRARVQTARVHVDAVAGNPQR